MQAGVLTDRIELLVNKGGRNAYNEQVEDWKVTGTPRAQVTAQNGRKALNSGQMWYPTARVIKIRHNATVVPGMRVRHEGAIYEIVSVVQDTHDNSTTLNCEMVNS